MTTIEDAAIGQSSEEIHRDRRSFLGSAAMTIAATQLAMIAPAEAGERAALRPIKAGTDTSFASLRQIDAGLLNVGYAEAGPHAIAGTNEKFQQIEDLSLNCNETIAATQLASVGIEDKICEPVGQNRNRWLVPRGVFEASTTGLRRMPMRGVLDSRYFVSP